MDKEEINKLSNDIIKAALEVHKFFGPGLLESAYRDALYHELQLRGIQAIREAPIPLTYKGANLGSGYRADLIVADEIIVELKATEKDNNLYNRQLFTYLKLTNKRLGLLINFNRDYLRGNIQRVVNNL